MLLKKVVLNNFQSHAYTEIDIAPTLTVIVGESDNGKSAVVRAIRWVLFNEPRGSDFIRVGASECSVSLIYEDGVTVTRVRNASGSKNRYIISRPGQEEQVFEGFGISVPEEVVKVTGVKKIKIDDDVSVDLHTAPQLDPPFLLMENGSVKARAIGRLTGTDIFDFAHKKATQDLNRTRDDLKQAKGELDILIDNLKEYDDLQQLEDTIQKLKGLIEKVDLLKERLVFLSEKREMLNRIDCEIHELDGIIEELKSIDNIENMALKTEALCDRYITLMNFKGSLSNLANGINSAEYVLKGTESLQECIAYLSELDVMVSKYKTVKGLCDKYKKNDKDLNIIYRALEDMKYIDISENIYTEVANMKEKLDVLTSMRDKLYGLKRELKYVEKVLDDSNELPEVEQLISGVQGILDVYRQLIKINQQLKDVKQNIAIADQDINKAQKSLNDMVNRYEELLKALKICPVCFSPITQDRAHEIAHNIAG
ncbi:exonuclease SbcC [Caldanaerobius fijiensis DSM 17918]|uniref:Nuclease SbcCD subunit C n=1 Tax=Caldanaerobius fijiensis DSM 17918 TaxID=1121256 RepID=A0A1M4UTF3_9THEO|nr:AAA family ATPase [Caldanaerobius fijiensis]SHE59964.1 exonuclease SbcC [Caldanaerobius fijiensis DSM 17918]